MSDMEREGLVSVPVVCGLRPEAQEKWRWTHVGQAPAK